MRGKRNFSPHPSSAANESASRICEGAIPTMIAAADPNASQRALRNKNRFLRVHCKWKLSVWQSVGLKPRR